MKRVSENSHASNSKGAPNPQSAEPVPHTLGGPLNGAHTLQLGGYDLAALRLDQSFASVAVEKVLATVPVRRPPPTDFVRVHPDKQFPTFVLDMKDDGEKYLLAPGLHLEVSHLVHPTCLRLAINRQGVAFLWPLRLAGADGRINPWHQSAIDAASQAETRWLSLRANKSLGAYDIFLGDAALSEPAWPDKPIEEIVEIAFRNHFIAEPGHPVLRRLRGEI
jgi:hypothetical protein